MLELIALTRGWTDVYVRKPAELTESKDGRYLYGICDVGRTGKASNGDCVVRRMGMFGMA